MSLSDDRISAPREDDIIAEVPEHVWSRARALLRMPGLDLDIADVEHDSLLDAVGGFEEPQRLLRFRWKETATVEVEVDLRPSGVALSVRVEPKARYVVTLLSEPELALASETDDEGVVGFADLPSGLLSLRVDPAERGFLQPFRTAWLVY